MSSITGSGVGGNVGGPPEPMPEDLAKTAATEVAKMMLGIVADSIEIPLSQVGKQNLWKYQSSADQPLLDHTLIQTRVSTSDMMSSQDINDLALDIAAKLIQMLPPEVAASYEQAMLRPLNERDPVYTALDNVLKEAAMSYALVQSALQDIETNSAVETRSIVNSALPYLAMHGSLADMTAVLSLSLNILNDLGWNYINQDALRRYTTESVAILTALQEAAGSIANAPETSSAQFKEVVRLASALNTEFDSLYSGNDMRILGDLLGTIALTATAMSVIAEGGSPSLILALSMALLHTNTAADETGLIGPALSAQADIISNALSTALFPPDDTSSRILLNNIVQTSLITGLIYAALLQDTAENTASEEKIGSAEEIQALTYELSSSLAVHSGNVNSVVNTMTTAAGFSGTVQEAIDEILTGNVAMMMVLAAVVPGKTSGDTVDLLQSLGVPISRAITLAEELTTNSRENGAIDSESSASFIIALQLMQEAIKNNDPDALVDAYLNLGGGVESADSRHSSFMQDIQGMKDTTQQVNAMITNNIEQTGNYTSIITAA